jgi:lysophospholipase L1-like esterase
MKAPGRDVLLVLGACMLAAGGAEAWFRLREPSDDLLRHVVSARMNLSRWTFLQANRDRLRTESTPPDLDPNRDRDVPPEPDRPAFDRIGVTWHVKTNALGFRERDFPPPDPARPRVLVLGDSVTFGKGVEVGDRYSDLLQRAWPDREVLNLGIQGCTTRCMADVLERHLGPATALVVVQASMNDLDLALWREAEGSRLAGPGRLALRLVAWSRALMALSHALFGDPQERQWAQAEDAAEAFYRPDAERILDRCARAGVPVAVVELPFATGRLPRHAMATACRRRPDACLGVVEVTMAPRVPGDTAPPPAWLLDSARELGFEPGDLARAFPLADHFLDVVHAGASGNRVAADQLEAFLDARWTAGKAAPGG